MLLGFVSVCWFVRVMPWGCSERVHSSNGNFFFQCMSYMVIDSVQDEFVKRIISESPFLTPL